MKQWKSIFLSDSYGIKLELTNGKLPEKTCRLKTVTNTTHLQHVPLSHLCILLIIKILLPVFQQAFAKLISRVG